MSSVKVKAALETALAAMTPALVTAWPNVAFTPPLDSSTPWPVSYTHLDVYKRQVHSFICFKIVFN